MNKDPELSLGLQAETMIGILVAGNLVIFPKKEEYLISKVHHREDHMLKHQRYFDLYEGDPEEEEAMAAMCYNCVTWSSIELN